MTSLPAPGRLVLGDNLTSLGDTTMMQSGQVGDLLYYRNVKVHEIVKLIDVKFEC